MAKKLAAKPAKKVKRVATTQRKKAVARPVVGLAKASVKDIPSKKGFNKTDLEHFRKIILDKRKQIIEELELMSETMNDSSGGDYFEENSPYSLHMEQGTDTMEKEKNYLLAARQRKFLEYLDDAIKRIDKGVYGFCQDCGKLIDKARLEAVPHAQLCITCKLKRGQ